MLNVPVPEFSEEVKVHMSEAYAGFQKSIEGLKQYIKDLITSGKELPTEMNEEIERIVEELDVNDKTEDYLIQFVAYGMYMLVKTNNHNTDDGRDMICMLAMASLSYLRYHKFKVSLAVLDVTTMMLDMYSRCVEKRMLDDFLGDDDE